MTAPAPFPQAPVPGAPIAGVPAPGAPVSGAPAPQQPPKSNTICVISGIAGIAIGIWLLISAALITSAGVSDYSGDLTSELTEGELIIGTQGAANKWLILQIILIIGILILGIATLVVYNGTQLVIPAAPILFLVGGIVGFIPYVGWIGGILIIVGGGLYLGSLRRFKPQSALGPQPVGSYVPQQPAPLPYGAPQPQIPVAQPQVQPQAPYSQPQVPVNQPQVPVAQPQVQPQAPAAQPSQPQVPPLNGPQVPNGPVPPTV